jgi:long-chain acyl-CoA synthetase
MGCSTSISKVTYNKYENSNDDNLSGPFINRGVTNYEEVTEFYKGKSWISEFLKIKDNFSNRQCLGYRKHLSREIKDNKIDNTFENKYTWFSFSEVFKMSDILSRNLTKYKLANYQNVPNEGQFNFLGFFSRNMVEYVITDLACQLANITSVTLYAVLGEEAFQFINEQTELSTLCISPDDNVDSIIKFKRKFGLPHLTNVILFDLTLIVPSEAETRLKEAGFNVYYFSKLVGITDGVKDINPSLAQSDSTYTICYTSGTTGLPKGARILQRNIIAQMSLIHVAGFEYDREVTLCYLPLAHIMERLNCLISLLNGGKIGLISGEVKTSIREDLQILKPTLFVTVPRLLNLFRDLILKKIDDLPDGCKKSIAKKAIEAKRHNFNTNKEITHSMYDSLVFKQIRQSLGGNLKLIISASAPLSKDTAADIKIFFSVPIAESYGMTESTGGVIGSHVTDLENNSCGGCIYASKIKLVDVPEMNYHSKTELDGKPSPTGEICIYGPLVFEGYFKNEKVTRETIDEDGWLHTGDIGRIMPDNLGLKIIDRKKEIFKLSQGEYIVPTKLEAVYTKSQFVAQICIHGDSFHDHIIAIICPNRENLISWLKSSGKVKGDVKLNSEELEKYFDDQEFINTVKDDLGKLAKDSNFNSLEKVNHLILSKIDFTIDNGCLTPTLKIVRRKIVELVKEKVDLIYTKK